MKIYKNFNLKSLNSYGLGGNILYFIEVDNQNDLLKSLSFIRNKKLPYYIIGGGSNIIINDNNFKGILLKISANNIRRISNSEIYVECGIILDELISKTIKFGFKGIEKMSGIPGTLGGAIRGNASAYGHEIKNVIKSVTGFTFEGKKFELKINECEFNYRDSFFKRNKNYIIFSSILQYNHSNYTELQKIRNDILNKRNMNIPLNFPSAGCVFQSPIINNQDIIELIPEKYLWQKNDSYYKIPAGFLLESCDLKGKIQGGFQISHQHSLFFLNKGNGRSIDLIKLINIAKKEVFKKFGIQLELEVELIGF